MAGDLRGDIGIRWKEDLSGAGEESPKLLLGADHLLQLRLVHEYLCLLVLFCHLNYSMIKFHDHSFWSHTYLLVYLI